MFLFQKQGDRPLGAHLTTNYLQKASPIGLAENLMAKKEFLLKDKFFGYSFPNSAFLFLRFRQIHLVNAQKGIPYLRIFRNDNAANSVTIRIFTNTVNMFFPSRRIPGSLQDDVIILFYFVDPVSSIFIINPHSIQLFDIWPPNLYT